MIKFFLYIYLDFEDVYFMIVKLRGIVLIINIEYFFFNSEKI